LQRSWGISTTCEQPLALAPTPLIQVGVTVIVALVMLWMLCHRDKPPKKPEGTAFQQAEKV